MVLAPLWLAWLSWANGGQIAPVAEVVGRWSPEATVEARLSREPVWVDPRLDDRVTVEQAVAAALGATWVEEGGRRTLLRDPERHAEFEVRARDLRTARIADGLAPLVDAFGKAPDGTADLDPDRLSRTWEQALRTSTTGQNPASVLARLALVSRAPADLSRLGLEWTQELEYGVPGSGEQPVWRAVLVLIARGFGRVEGLDAHERPTLTRFDPGRLRAFVQLSGSPESLFATAHVTLDDGTVLDTGQALVPLPRARIEPDRSEGPDLAVWTPGFPPFLRDRAFPRFRGDWGRWAVSLAPRPVEAPPSSEPLRWLEPLLSAEAEASSLPMVVNLPDDVLPVLIRSLQEGGRLAPGVLGELVAKEILEREVVAGVAVYRPSDPARAEATRIDRRAMASLVKGAVDTGSVTLPGLAGALVSSPATSAQGFAFDSIVVGLWEAGVAIPPRAPDRDFARLLARLRPSAYPASASTSTVDLPLARMVRELGWTAELSAPGSAGPEIGAVVLQSGAALRATFTENREPVFVREGFEEAGPLSLARLAEFAAAQPDLDRGWNVRSGTSTTLTLSIEGPRGLVESRAYSSAPVWIGPPGPTSGWPKALREEFDRSVAAARERIGRDAKNRDTTRP